jgi:hypothetical protein
VTAHHHPDRADDPLVAARKNWMQDQADATTHDSLDDLTASDRALIRRGLWTLATVAGRTGKTGKRAIALAEMKFPKP